MLERPCPRRRFHPVKAQVSQQLWTEVNLSASPTSPPHSHSRPVSGCCECVCVCVCARICVCVSGRGRERDGGRAVSWLDSGPCFFCGSDPAELPSLPFFFCSALLLCLVLPFSSCLHMDGWILRWLRNSSTGGKRTYEHGMPSDSSETVRVFVNSTCFTATLAVVLRLLTVHSRNLPSLYNALLQQSLCNLQIYFLYHSSPAMFWDRDCIDRVNIWTVVLYFLRVCSPLPLFLTLVTNFSLCQLT